MKFEVRKVSDSNYIGSIEFTSIEKFIEWVREQEHSIIVNKDGKELLIYDSYIE